MSISVMMHFTLLLTISVIDSFQPYQSFLNSRQKKNYLLHPFVSNNIENLNIMQQMFYMKKRLQLGLHSSWSIEDNWSSLSEKDSQETLPESGAYIDRIVDLDVIENDESTPEEKWIHDSLDAIQDSAFDSDDLFFPIYDTFGDKHMITTEDSMGREIAMLVRCNESPQDMLIAEGRALSPISETELNDPSQLVVVQNIDNNDWKMTEFFHHAIDVMFSKHANPEGLMRAAEVASWMSTSLKTRVNANDKRVFGTITRFGEYGTGTLSKAGFQQIYTTAMNVVLQGSKSKPIITRYGIKEHYTIENIWRDIRNHDILSPVEVARKFKELELQKNFKGKKESQSHQDVLDECEILDLGNTFATTTHQTSWSDVKDREYSSHELVDMAQDGQTPLYVRDGEFIFIDEESCIGCMPCAATAPSSFLMLDHGRARTFEQRNDPDVAAAVETCPVSCMHPVSFHELKELETARDKGDGRSDHRHCGSSKGYTPLHVSRVGTDANKKDSWYHYLKQKCYCK
jgi:ferredoxin